jgi:hypothetical protein
MRRFGDAGEPELDDRLLAAKRALMKGPRPEVATAHLAAMAEAVRDFGAEAMATSPHSRKRRLTRGRVMRTMRRVAISVAVATVAAMASMTGLAYAGVGLPSAALTAFHTIGINLPNQAASLPDASQHGQEVSSAATAGSGGCAFGQSIAEIASSKSADSHASTHRQDGTHRPANVCDQANSAQPNTPQANQGQAPGYGPGNHPSGSSEEGISTNPTGNGQTTHPSDSTTGQASNPTGYGETSHPSDSTTGQASNPTGYGPSNHPG